MVLMVHLEHKTAESETKFYFNGASANRAAGRAIHFEE